MQVIVKGKNLPVSDALRKYALEKLEKVRKHFDPIREAVIEFSVEKNPSISDRQHVDVTLFVRGSTIRAEQSSADMYASIDQVIEKLERQVAKLKGKSYASKSANNRKLETPPIEEGAFEPQIFRTRQFAGKPMSVEEARLEIEMLGHDFYMFRNSDSEEINVLYRRRDGHYGLIEPS